MSPCPLGSHCLCNFLDASSGCLCMMNVIHHALLNQWRELQKQYHDVISAQKSKRFILNGLPRGEVFWNLSMLGFFESLLLIF